MNSEIKSLLKFGAFCGTVLLILSGLQQLSAWLLNIGWVWAGVIVAGIKLALCLGFIVLLLWGFWASLSGED
jgi:hypothetical protein